MEEKKLMKINLSAFLLLLAIIVILIMAYYIYAQKVNYSKEITQLEANTTNMQSTINDLQKKLNSISSIISTNTENTSNAISVSYIVVQVEDTDSVGLAYKSKKITDKQKIEDLMNIINNAIEYKAESFIPDFGDMPPRVEIYNSKGEKYTIAAGDQISDNGHIVNLMTKWYSQDGSNKTLFMVESKLGEYIENLYNN